MNNKVNGHLKKLNTKNNNSHKLNTKTNNSHKTDKLIHELRQPLGAINMLADLNIDDMNQTDSPERDKMVNDYLNLIVQQSKQCLSIIEKMQQKDEFDTENFIAFDINKLINKVLVEVEYNIDAESVSIQRDLKPQLPHITGDPKSLHQLFSNLFRNAVYAMKDSSKKLMTVTSRKNDQTVHVIIMDTGCGMKEADKDKIFDAYYSTKYDEGMGLGLSICKDIVNAHNGTISVKSEENIGTSFEIILPAR